MRDERFCRDEVGCRVHVGTAARQVGDSFGGDRMVCERSRSDLEEHRRMDTLTTTDTAPRTLLGVGLYTAADAAGLPGIPALRIRRWLAGYAHGPRDAQNWSDPLWTPQLPRIGQDVALGFRDLMELRFIASFVAAGISLHSIRRALAIGRPVVGDERPFSTTRFHTDGRTIFLQVSHEVGEPTCYTRNMRFIAWSNPASATSISAMASRNDGGRRLTAPGSWWTRFGILVIQSWQSMGCRRGPSRTPWWRRDRSRR